MPKEISAEDAPGLLKPGMTAFLQGSSGEPTPLFEALEAQPEASDGVHYVGCLIPGINRHDPAGWHPNATATGFFVGADQADSFARRRFRYLPLHYSGIYAHLASLPPTDLALVQVAPPDRAGNCSLGVSLDFQPAMLDKAKAIVAEVNAQMPVPSDGATIPWDRLSYVVRTDRPLVQFESGGLNDTIRVLGERVAGLIEDGDTIQIGIGKAPAAILNQLHGKRDLGLQGGMITDEVLALVESGAITNARKSIDRGKLVCGSAIGTEKVYGWPGVRTEVLYRPVSYTHEVRVVSQLDNFVSINSVLEVDLTGQANAEMLAGRQVSGTGGLVDFVRSARMAKNGRSILALTATAAGGKASRIVPRLDAGSVVSALRADVDYVVTEFGAARLKDKSIDERAEALIAVAAPAFRQSLAEEWERLRRRG
jgi:4-hydroxybutyrate CoA-transferase